MSSPYPPPAYPAQTHSASPKLKPQPQPQPSTYIQPYNSSNQLSPPYPSHVQPYKNPQPYTTNQPYPNNPQPYPNNQPYPNPTQPYPPAQQQQQQGYGYGGGPMYYQAQPQGYYADRRGGPGAGEGICAAVMASLACCCCLDFLI